MEAPTKNETNESTKRFSKISINKVEIIDETKNDSAHTKLELKKLVEQARSKNLEIIINAVVEIRKMISQSKNPPIDEIIQSGIVPDLIEFLKNSDTKLQYETASILTNIASGTFEQTKVIIDSGAVPVFLQFLHSSDHNVSNQVAWALGNIIADKTQFYNYCIELGLIEEILKIDFSKLRIKNLRTLTWIMANLCRNKEICTGKNVGKLFLPLLEMLVFNRDDEILGECCREINCWLIENGISGTENFCLDGPALTFLTRGILYVIGC
jgi:importin subunit alpha-1